MVNQVIIGNGISGITAALTLMKLDPNSKITLITEEDFPTYARMILPDYIAGRIPEQNLFSFQGDLFNSIRMIMGKKVEEIRSQEHVIVVDGNKKFPYDNLLMASGASALTPKIEGIHQKGIYALRDIEDARKIIASARPGNKGIVLGGGLVGLETTNALRTRGLMVELVVSSPQILSKVFDSKGAKIVEDVLIEHGIIVYKNADVIGIESVKGKKILFLKTGEKLEGDFIVIAKGVKPNVDFINNHEITLDQGVIVNRKMQTSVPNIYASGDVAMAPGFFEEAPIYNAIWGEAIYQAGIAANNMAGTDSLYSGNLRANIFEVLGLKASSIGQGGLQTEGSKIFSIEKPKSYKKLVFREERLVGALLIGDIEESGFLQHLIRMRINLSGQEEILLRNRIQFGMYRMM